MGVVGGARGEGTVGDRGVEGVKGGGGALRDMR